MAASRIITIAALLASAYGRPSWSNPHSLSVNHLDTRAACSGNTASTRSQWCDYSIDTDYMTEVPDTGVTREYWLDLTEVTVAPDGVSRSAMAINGSIPGPTLFADWGDTVKIHVTNSLSTSTNGTSIHWHGIRQNYTNDQDGVASITQCPTAPGNSLTYTWRATQYGSTWYHSHFALQAWEGVFGGLIINGPATADYDEDLGMLFLNDWDHQTVDELFMSAQTNGPPTLANALINGTNTYENGGHRYNTTFTADKSYRIRLVNSAVDTHFKFMVDNHTMTVISADLIPVTPYTTNVLDISMGQRYDVIIKADQASVASSFWMRAIPQSACSDVENADDVRGIVYYGGAETSTPTTLAYDYDDGCDDETPNLVPHVSKTVGTDNVETDKEVTFGFNSDNFFRWYLNSTTMVVQWGDATLNQIVTNSSFSESNAVVHLPKANQWFYLAIHSTLPIPHPIHLHGHDFFVLAQGKGTYDESTVSLNLDNPPRRDTAILPSAGYMVMAFETDNPGAWLMHCHIGWHTSEGFALQFVERQDEILGITDSERVTSTCATWNAHEDEFSIEQEDSGI